MSLVNDRGAPGNGADVEPKVHSANSAQGVPAATGCGVARLGNGQSRIVLGGRTTAIAIELRGYGEGAFNCPDQRRDVRRIAGHASHIRYGRSDKRLVR